VVDKYIKSNVCPLPWTHLEVDVNGGASPCCLYKGSVPGVKVYEQSLSSIQQTEYMQELRDKFMNGERPVGCQSCWQEEDAGKTSKRQNSIYKMKKSLANWTPNSEPTLKFIDFKLGNVCNLKCRICGSWSSSKWAQEELDYGENPVARRNLREGGWPKKNPQFFEFTGGEPFMIRDHFKILMHCVEKGYARNIDIHYNTNGTQLPPKDIFDLWSYFKHVEVAFSIDDVGEPFEYQRHPAKWREVNQNLVKFKEMRTANMDFQICSTVSIFNVFNWAKMALWVAQFQPKFFYVNTCFDPDVFNIQTLPRQVKDIVVDRYHMLTDYQPSIRFMNAEDRDTPEIRAERKRRILQTDAYRKENFGDMFPLLNNILKIYD